MVLRLEATRFLRRMIPGPVVRIFRSFEKLDQHTKRFIEHNRQIWHEWARPDAPSVILFDDFGGPETLISYSYFLNVLAHRYNARLVSFSTRQFLPSGLSRVWQSFNAHEHLSIKLDKGQAARRDKLLREVLPRLQSKKDLFDLEILGCWIGIDIYESYLTRYRMPTISLTDPRFFEVLNDAIALLVFWTDYLELTNVAGVVVSHDSFIELDILCKVAYGRGIPVYLPNARGISFSDRPHAIYEHMASYRDLFATLPQSQQQAGITWAKRQLERRMSGEVGVDMPYSTKSAFQRSHERKTVLRGSEKIKVLIATHCFYDNPHAYGGMFFLDFMEWLQFLGRISERTDYDWYIKVHPDPMPGTLKVVARFTEEFPTIVTIPPETSHLQLVEEGIQFVLTCYGTVGLEYPLLGIPVITAAYNPTSSFDFNWHPETLQQYEEWLMHLDTLKFAKSIDLNNLYACYYMNYDYWFVDDLIFDSHREFTRTQNGGQQVSDQEIRKLQVSSFAYKYFLDSFDHDKHSATIRRMEAFIESEKSGAGRKVMSRHHLTVDHSAKATR